MKRFLAVVLMMLLVGGLFSQSYTPGITLLYNDKTGTTVNPLRLINPEVGIADGKVTYMENGVLIGVGTILTEEVVYDYSAKTTTNTNAGLKNFLLATASTVEIASSSSNDDVDGTGARTILIKGLDSDYLPIEETVTLTGQTVVVTTNEWLRINSVEVVTAGSGGKNAGDIYVALDDTFSSGVPQTASKIIHVIITGNSKTLSAFYTVPSGNRMFIRSIKVASGTAQIVTANVYVKGYGGVWKKLNSNGLYQNQVELLNSKSAYKLPAKTDVYITASAPASAVVNAIIEYDLIDE